MHCIGRWVGPVIGLDDVEKKEEANLDSKYEYFS
jgi:hypothetical protein